MCLNGGNLVICDNCSQALCNKCLVIPPTIENYEHFKFFCLHCHSQIFKGPALLPYYMCPKILFCLSVLKSNRVSILVKVLRLRSSLQIHWNWHSHCLSPSPATFKWQLPPMSVMKVWLCSISFFAVWTMLDPHCNSHRVYAGISGAFTVILWGNHIWFGQWHWVQGSCYCNGKPI